MHSRTLSFFFFFFNDTATTEIYTLSLHDALPIWTQPSGASSNPQSASAARKAWYTVRLTFSRSRSEEHTSELQSPCNLVCRLLLEKKKKKARHYPKHRLHTGQERIRPPCHMRHSR